ncbi:hypothetical protein predicted by Glimmer/Critica [Sorangium cellulosum So ce56]|uniref:Uncharacterized protein n=1 Tax=Sorangium cellulosum (strain So ce56) TaxID=448385 RepID=A9FYN9_SORC5|nr:hypothetical protein predicted by Glimmer/Critica [Sorangium cellulosum So ce56]
MRRQRTLGLTASGAPPSPLPLGRVVPGYRHDSPAPEESMMKDCLSS